MTSRHVASVRRMLDPLDLLLGAPAATVDGAGVVRQPLHFVDLGKGVPGHAVPQLLQALEARSSVVIGVSPGCPEGAAAEVAQALDLTLIAAGPAPPPWAVLVDDTERTTALLQVAADRTPRAALVLGALLRATALLPGPIGLTAEASAYSALLAGPEHDAWLAHRGAPRPAADDGDERVAVHRQGDVLHVRLTRPLRRNAFDARMRRALTDALAVAEADPVLAVRLSADGPVFSSGGDLDEFGTRADPATAWVVRTSDHPGATLLRLSQRTHVHVHGACAGAGVELAAFAGRLTADPGTTFRLPELSMGLLPGAGGTVSLTHRIGRWRTAWMALSGATVDAATAQLWGLVDGVETAGG